ncbi:DinB family protein [Muricauda oceani]|uniref:DinB family protein n=1 Tax=Flagellimonas oceani TaxID=2698672 RepID=A0A6G7J5I8_9FLAO|nr:DinB family protein [Allomuricauda oceani]MBW8242378.1 DinB family protein [Allomuricauda oceani]QII46133.1 DinB family protein [Allomuricauda oceani]
MKKLPYFLIVFIFMLNTIKAQESDLPYKEIPPYPTDYASGNLVARMIDGLGYRYYWATEGLTEQDLGHKPSEEGRSAMQTLDHIYSLSHSILMTNKGEHIIREDDSPDYSFDELRKMTLENFKEASDLVLGKDIEDLEQLTIVFQQGENQSEFPYWNMINGMITDCIHHTGQIVLMRRSSGNPQNPNVNVFLGKTKE